MCENHVCNCEENTCSGDCGHIHEHTQEEKHQVRIISFTDKVSLHYNPDDKISTCNFEESVSIIYNDMRIHDVKRISVYKEGIYFFNEQNQNLPFVSFGNMDDKILKVYETNECNLFSIYTDMTIKEFNMDKYARMSYYPKYSSIINKTCEGPTSYIGYESIIKVKATEFDEEVILARNITDTMSQAISNINYFYNDSTAINSILVRISKGDITSVFYNNELYDISCLRDYGIEVKNIVGEGMLIPYHLLSRTECIFMTKIDYIIIDNNLYCGTLKIENRQDIIDDVKKLNTLGDDIDAPDRGLEEEKQWLSLHNDIVHRISLINSDILNKKSFNIFIVDGRNKYVSAFTVDSPITEDEILFNDEQVEE